MARLSIAEIEAACDDLDDLIAQAEADLAEDYAAEDDLDCPGCAICSDLIEAYERMLDRQQHEDDLAADIAAGLDFRLLPIAPEALA